MPDVVGPTFQSAQYLASDDGGTLAADLIDQTSESGPSFALAKIHDFPDTASAKVKQCVVRNRPIIGENCHW
jgi:hypothetical protein